MDQELSNDQVNTLLSAVSDGSIEVEGQKNSEDVSSQKGKNLKIVPHDLTKRDHVIRSRMPTLDIVYERFVRLFRMSLSNSLRKFATLNMHSTDMVKFGDFVNELPIPSCMCIIRFESLNGSALLLFEAKLAYALLESFLGGVEKVPTKMRSKEFTRIELSIMKQVMDLAIKDLEEAWLPIHHTEISFVRTEVNPQFVGIVPPSDLVISTVFKLELENETGTVGLAVPYATLEPIKNKLNALFHTESEKGNQEWREKLEEHLKNTDLKIQVDLGNSEITVGDLVDLSIGDIIPLNQDAEGELDLLIEGIPKLKCFLGVSKGNRAVQITRAIDE